jgi:hypothetical protein
MAKDCGHKVPCGCKDTGLLTPPPCGDGIDCEGTPCSETFDADCVYYTGEDIICDGTTIVATNTTVANAIQSVVNTFCDETEIDADILCGEDVVVAAGAQVEDAVADVVNYFCTALENIHLFDSTTYQVVADPDGEGLPCTTFTHTITYLDDLGATITSTVFTTRTCEEVDLCQGTVLPVTESTNVVICDNGDEALTTVEKILALSQVQGLFAQTADASVANTLISTSLVGSGVGTTSIAAGAIEEGSTYEVKMRGTISVGTPVDLTIKLIVDGTNVDQVGPISMPNIGGGGFGTKYFEVDGIFTCRTPGATGGIISSLTFAYEENASDKFDSHTSDIFAPINTTVINTVGIEAEWTSADPSNSLTSQIFTLRKIY